MGVEVVACITGDGRVDDIRRAHGAALNVVQCSGSMTHLAKTLKEKYGMPFIRVSYFGIEDMAEVALRRGPILQRSGDDAADPGTGARGDRSDHARNRRYAQAWRARKRGHLRGRRLQGLFAGAALRLLGMQTVMVGSQTGNREDYEQLRELCDEGTIIVDDSNPLELASFLQEKEVDLFIGGVKERPIAYKLGIGFCDHNHERKEALAGFEGM